MSVSSSCSPVGFNDQRTHTIDIGTGGETTEYQQPTIPRYIRQMPEYNPPAPPELMEFPIPQQWPNIPDHVRYLVVYTFDTADMQHMASQMLCVSIKSVYRTLGSEAHILICTTMPTALQSWDFGVGNISIVSVGVPHMRENMAHVKDPRSNKAFTTACDVSLHFNTIGHSRIWLLPAILEYYALPILYLDNDTVVYDDYADARCLKTMLAEQRIGGYVRENWSFLGALFSMFQSSFSTETFQAIDLRMTIVNNGAQFIPANSWGVTFLKRVLYHYKVLLHDCHTIFSDMIAFTMAFNEASVPQKRFYMRDYDGQPVYHYYIFKYRDQARVMYICEQLLRCDNDHMYHDWIRQIRNGCDFNAPESGGLPITKWSTFMGQLNYQTKIITEDMMAVKVE